MLWKYTLQVYIFPHCMRIFSKRKIYWKYTKVVVKPKVISCFRKKPENRRQNKLTLKLVWARKTQGLNMGWNGELWAGLGESIWIWTGNGWERLHMDGGGFKTSRSRLNVSGSGWE